MFRTYDLHKALYHDIRSRFHLAAQMVVRLLAKVGDSYKLRPAPQTHVPAAGTIAYDSRILQLDLAHGPSRSGRWMAGKPSRSTPGTGSTALLVHQHGETDLVYRKGQFYLLATCDVADPDPIDVDGGLGIDLGVTNIAVDSDGTTYSGSHIKNVRYRHRRLRRKLQRKGTHGTGAACACSQDKNGALRPYQPRFSKQLVTTAERTKRAIAVEDLTHIRSRIRAMPRDV